MLLAVECYCYELQRLPPPNVADDRTRRRFVVIASELPLCPERGADRVGVAVRHHSAIDAFQHPQSLAAPKASLPYVVQVTSTYATNSIEAR
jgi:hypothetical protein